MSFCVRIKTVDGKKYSAVKGIFTDNNEFVESDESIQCYSASEARIGEVVMVFPTEMHGKTIYIFDNTKFGECDDLRSEI